MRLRTHWDIYLNNNHDKREAVVMARDAEGAYDKARELFPEAKTFHIVSHVDGSETMIALADPGPKKAA